MNHNELATEEKTELKISELETKNLYLKDDIKELRSSNRTLAYDARIAKARILKLEGTVGMMDENTVRKVIDATLEDAKSVHKSYRAVFFKVCVATEMRYFLRGNLPRQAVVLAGVVKAYDLNEKFWDGLSDAPLITLDGVFFEIGSESGLLNESEISH